MNLDGAAVLGVDPGRSKAGYALVARTGAVMTAGIEPIERLHERLVELVARSRVDAIALGGGTNVRAIKAALEGLGPADPSGGRVRDDPRRPRPLLRGAPPAGVAPAGAAGAAAARPAH